METVAPFKEVIDEIKEKGGDAVKFCYQCGKCDTVCPWNRVRKFSMRKLIREATFGVDRDRKGRDLAVHHLRQVSSAMPQGRKTDR